MTEEAWSVFIIPFPFPRSLSFLESLNRRFTSIDGYTLIVALEPELARAFTINVVAVSFYGAVYHCSVRAVLE